MFTVNWTINKGLHQNSLSLNPTTLTWGGGGSLYTIWPLKKEAYRAELVIVEPVSFPRPIESPFNMPTVAQKPTEAVIGELKVVQHAVARLFSDAHITLPFNTSPHQLSWLLVCRWVLFKLLTLTG